MPRIVTVGFDGSPESLTAAQWAAREAVRRRLPLQLVHAMAPPPTAYGPYIGPGPRTVGAGQLAETAAGLRDAHPGPEITTDRISGEPAALLPVIADGSELLVLGSRGFGGVAGFLVGSVALSTVARIERPVVLVRAGWTAADEHRTGPDGLPSATTPYREVVLGLDLGRPCDELLEFAFDAAARRAAPLRVVHAWALPSLFTYGPDPIDTDRREQAAVEARALADALRPWHGKFPDVHVIEESALGRPASRLVHAAAGAGLVVVGKRIRHSLVGSRIGPVTHAVLHHSSAPVAVVPHD